MRVLRRMNTITRGHMTSLDKIIIVSLKNKLECSPPVIRVPVGVDSLCDMPRARCFCLDLDTSAPRLDVTKAEAVLSSSRMSSLSSFRTGPKIPVTEEKHIPCIQSTWTLSPKIFWRGSEHKFQLVPTRLLTAKLLLEIRNNAFVMFHLYKPKVALSTSALKLSFFHLY